MMGDMEIPEKAVNVAQEAVAKRLSEWSWYAKDGASRAMALDILLAAAPFIAAQAWDEGYEAGDIDNDPGVRSKIERGINLPLMNPYRGEA